MFIVRSLRLAFALAFSCYVAAPGSAIALLKGKIKGNSLDVTILAIGSQQLASN